MVSQVLLPGGAHGQRDSKAEVAQPEEGGSREEMTAPVGVGEEQQPLANRSI